MPGAHLGVPGDGAQLHDRPALDAGVQAPHLLSGQLSHPGVFIESVVFLGVFYSVSGVFRRCYRVSGVFERFL